MIFSLSHNRIFGTIPTQIGNLISLGNLYVFLQPVFLLGTVIWMIGSGPAFWVPVFGSNSFFFWPQRVGLFQIIDWMEPYQLKLATLKSLGACMSNQKQYCFFMLWINTPSRTLDLISFPQLPPPVFVGEQIFFPVKLSQAKKCPLNDFTAGRRPPNWWNRSLNLVCFPKFNFSFN